MLYKQKSIDDEVMSGTPVFAKEAAISVLKMAKVSLTSEKILYENFA